MRRPAASVIAGAALTLCSVCTPAAALAATADGPAAPPGQAASPDPMRTVLVTLEGGPAPQLPPPDVSGDPGAVREVIRSLRPDAREARRDISARLHELRAQGEVTRSVPLWITNGLSVTATAPVINELAARPDVAAVVPDQITLVPSAVAGTEPGVASLGTPEVWESGDTGQGVVVASLDSGVDVTHPDLAGGWRGGANSWFDPYGSTLTRRRISAGMGPPPWA